MTLWLIAKSLVYLFGTFLHELAHYCAAAVVGTPEGFSVIPRVSGDKVVFGSTSARVRYKVLGTFVSIAPLLWWGALFLLLRYSIPPETISLLLHFDAGPLLKYVKSFSLGDVFFLWFAFQLLWAGRLSSGDIRVLLGGIFSLSGMILILAGISLFFVIGRV